MTVRDPEVLEALGNDPELLALADAIHETQPRPQRPGRRSVSMRLAPLAAAVVAVILAVLLIPDRVAHRGVIARALAAIGNGRVLHLRTETPSGLVYVDLASGRRTVVMLRNEVWYDRDTKRFHYLMESQGKVADIVWPDDAKQGATLSDGGIDPAFAALWGGYREALDNGDAKLEREGAVEGRPVYWLRFPSPRSGTPGTEVAIDRKTYKPVLFREYASNGRRVDERVLAAETKGFDRADFKRRGPDLFSFSTSTGGYSSDLPPKRPVLHAPWLTAGATAAGLRLSAVNAASKTTRGRTLDGVILIYGSVSRSPEELSIEEYLKPDYPDVWASIPHNAVAVQSGDDVIGPRHKHTKVWTGTLVRHGIYVTIATTRGERALLEVARALRPAR